MATPRESLAAWLRDAHAMEGQAETFLQTQIDRLKNLSGSPAAPQIPPRGNQTAEGRRRKLPEAARRGYLNPQGCGHEVCRQPARHDPCHGE
jgi:hypothetical protein